MTTILDARETKPREGGATFPLSHRLERAVWTLVWGLLGSWTPTPLFGWRRFLLRLFGAKLAPTAKVYPGVKVWYPRNLRMERFACLGPGVNCYDMAQITLEEHALVSQGAHLCGGTHDVDDEHFQLKARPIRLGSNAWVASEAFVAPGVTLGEGAVLGARGVAFKDLDAWSIYGGNPAQFLRKRAVRPTADAGR
jgi:putative colanic acid biosynthesis acetyltransferase WcaF